MRLDQLMYQQRPQSQARAPYAYDEDEQVYRSLTRQVQQLKGVVAVSLVSLAVLLYRRQVAAS